MASVNVDVRNLEENKRIFLEWNGPANPSFGEWISRRKGRTEPSLRLGAAASLTTYANTSWPMQSVSSAALASSSRR
jgi:hypothetical protein